MWHYIINDQQHGPVSEAELRDLLERKIIDQETLVWRDGTRNWLKINQLDLTPPDAAPEVNLPQPIRPLVEGQRVCAFSGEPLEENESFQFDGFEISNKHREEAEAYFQTGGSLPTARSGLRAQGNLEIAYLFTKAWALVKSCALPASVLFLLVHIPLAIAFAHVEPVKMFVPPTPEQAKALLLSLVFGTLVTGGCLYLFRQHSRGDRADFQRTALAALALWGPLLAATLGTFVCIVAGGFPLVLPGMYIGIRLALTNAALVERRLTPLAAYQHSWAVTKGYVMHTIGYMVLMMLAVVLPLAVAGAILGSALTGIVRLILPGADVEMVGSALDAACNLTSIFPAACVYCYFRELEARYLATASEHR